MLAGITVLAYGLLLPMTGFYWDDWPFAWLARFLGPGEFIPAFRGFRPFLGPIFFLTTSVLPTNPVVWQVFALVSAVPVCAGGVVRAEQHLAEAQAAGADRHGAVPGVPGIQPAVGGADTRQPGVDPVHLLSLVVRVHRAGVEN